MITFFMEKFKMLNFRSYEDADFEKLCNIHDQARKQELKFANLEAAFIPFKIASKKEQLFEDYQVYVATKENKVVGFVGFNEEELGWLYVDPKVQGQGIGSKLIDFTLENSTRPFYLEVLEGNPAPKLYLKKGFITIKHESGKMPGNESFSVEVDLMEYK